MTQTSTLAPNEEAPTKPRWWFWALFPLAGLIVLAFVFKKPLMNKYINWKLNPGKPFAAIPAPPAPDYKLPENWGALPTKKDYSDYTPTGVAPVTSPRRADVFFIHPTTYFSGKSWNASIEVTRESKAIQTAVFKHQASAFNACCRIYAPLYRQATIYFAFAFEPNGRQALDLAYTDVVKAFQHYIKHWNKGRPFFVVGHSQGAMHGLRLLEEHIAKTPLQKQLIAAYIVGNPIHKDKLTRTLAPLHTCQHATDTGCVISWMSMGPKGDIRRYSRLPKYYPSKGYEIVKDRPHICVNPITWKADKTPSTYPQHLGAVRFQRGKAPMAPPQVSTVKGGCVNGAMVIDKSRIKEGFKPRLAIFGKEDYHIYDFNLYYMNIRQNAVARANAFLQRQASTKTLLPPHTTTPASARSPAPPPPR